MSKKKSKDTSISAISSTDLDSAQVSHNLASFSGPVPEPRLWGGLSEETESEMSKLREEIVSLREVMIDIKQLTEKLIRRGR